MKLSRAVIADKLTRHYERLGNEFKKRLAKKMDLLMEDPFNTALQIELTGFKPLRRTRIGEFRVFFRYDFPNETILIASLHPIFRKNFLA